MVRSSTSRNVAGRTRQPMAWPVLDRRARPGQTRVATRPSDIIRPSRAGRPQSAGGTDWDLSKFAVISGLMTPSASSRDMPALPYTALLRA